MNKLPLTLLLGVVASLAACGTGGDAALELDVDRQTTSPSIAISNLSSQISATQKRVALAPRDLSAREQLVNLLLARTQYLGSYEDFDLAFETVEAALSLELQASRTALLHAKLLTAVHRFSQASAELDRAEALGADVTIARETIALATGQDATAIISTRDASAEATPSYIAFTRLSAALSAGGLYEEADLAFHQALQRYRDVSPFPIAWVAFQRGVLWGEKADDPERAYALYQIAVERLPQYVVGNVHLSELEVERGLAEQAIARLRAIVDETSDPEPASRLAQYLAESDPVEAAHYAELAREGYEHFLSRYPLAFSDHATEFYLGAGDDSERALELALLNLDNRKTPRAYGLAVGAAQAHGETALACQLAREGGLDEASCD